MASAKKLIALMRASVRQEYVDHVDRKRQKEVERVLLPDAPPRKRQSRKQSPVRAKPRLVAGTPLTPPPPKPHEWYKRKQVEAVEVVKEVDVAAEVADVPWCPPVVAEMASIIEVEYIDQMDSPKVESAATLTAVLVEPQTIELDPGVKVRDVHVVSHPDAASMPSSSSSSSNTKSTPESDLIMDKTLELENCLVEDDADEEDEFKKLDTDIDEAQLWHLEDDCNSDLLPDAAIWLEREDQAADEAIRDLMAEKAQANLTFDWSCDREKFHGTREEFTGTPGPTFPVSENTRPMEIFLKFFDHDLLTFLAQRTNKHGTKLITENTKPHSRLLEFKNTDKDEMAVFLAILILQGCAPLPVESDYWSENGYLAMPNFKKIMGMKRFLLLKRLLHVEEDTDGQTDGNKLRKIAPVLDHLNRKFSELYLPGQNVAVDESLLKWHGALTFAQRIATKAGKVGIKSYELCESATGYLWRFFIYTGKSQQVSNEDAEEQEESQSQENLDTSCPPPPSNVTAKIVCELVEPLLNKGHAVVMDNFYNSPLLARYLKANRTDCYGTLRINRDFVPESIKSVSKSDMRVGELYQTFCNDLSIVLWRDTKLVAMISTCHGGETGGREKYGKYKYMPQVVIEYNKTMGGIDLKDAMLANFCIERKRNLKWYKKLFRRVLNVTILNAYVILKTQNKRITHRAFRIQLAEELIATFNPKPVERPLELKVFTIPGPRGNRRTIVEGNHFIGEGPSKHARCVMCKTSRTCYICKQCRIALCLKECFERYHSRN